MGVFVRKTIPLGLFRIHITNSGVGLSVGFKNARIFFGPYATYLDIGSDGVYYSKRLGRRKKKVKNSNKYRKTRTVNGKTQYRKTKKKLPFFLILLWIVAIVMTAFSLYILVNITKLDTPEKYIAPIAAVALFTIGVITDTAGRKKYKNNLVRAGKMLIIISVLAVVFIVLISKNLSSPETVEEIGRIIQG